MGFVIGCFNDKDAGFLGVISAFFFFFTAQIAHFFKKRKRKKDKTMLAFSTT